jgi:hypothetical protein
MAVVILLDGKWAELTDWKWTSSSKELAEKLNSLLDEAGTSPSDTNPDLTEAKRIASMLGGEIIHSDEVPVSNVPGRIY